MTDESAMDPATDPFDRFQDWMAEAEASEPNDPNAFALATATADGAPSARMLLLKGVDEVGGEDRGFVFYTNLESRKAGEIAENPRAAMLFHWKSLRRQIRVEGPLARVSDAEADAYFATRPRGSQIGAWASDQSRPYGERAELVKRVKQVESRYEDQDPPRPLHWSGTRLTPTRFEFWASKAFRLHDRLVYRRIGGMEKVWDTQRLFP